MASFADKFELSHNKFTALLFKAVSKECKEPSQDVTQECKGVTSHNLPGIRQIPGIEVGHLNDRMQFVINA